MQIPGVHIETLHNPTRYSFAQIERACAMAALLNRGKLVLVEPPRQLAPATGWAGDGSPPSRPRPSRQPPATTCRRELVEPAEDDVRAPRAPPRRAGTRGWGSRSCAARRRARRGCRCGSPRCRRPRAGSTPIRRAASRNTSGAGLPRATSSLRDPGAEDLAPARGRHHVLDDLLVGGGRERERPARGDPRDGRLGAGQQRQRLVVGAQHVLHDAVGDLRRLERHAELLVRRSATTRASSCRASPPSRRPATASPCSATSALRPPSHADSESSRRPSRSKMTAWIKRGTRESNPNLRFWRPPS